MATAAETTSAVEGAGTVTVRSQDIATLKRC